MNINDFNRFAVKSHKTLFLQCSQLTPEVQGIEK